MKTTLKRVGGLVITLASVVALGACGPDKGSDKHTYNAAFTLSPATFNPLQYKSTTDRVPLDYTTDSFYEYSYNAAGNGFELVPVMAAADPVDKTSLYAKDYNLTNTVDIDTYLATPADARVEITEADLDSDAWEICSQADYNAFRAKAGDNADDWTDTDGTLYAIFTGFKIYASANYAFRIALNPDACWEDGTPIKAEDYVYTMKELLDPDFNNYRASDYYNGSTVIANAKNYFYSGRTVMISDEGLYDKEIADLWFDIDGDNFFGFTSTYGGNLDGFWHYFADTYAEWASAGWDADDLLCKDPDTQAVRFADAEGKTKADYADKNAFVNAFIDFKMTGNGSNAVRQHIGALKNYVNEHAEASGIRKGMVPFADVEEMIGQVITDVYGGYAQYACEFACYESQYPLVPWDDVGLKVIDDYTLDIVYTGELIGFYQKYSIGLPLVNKTLYEACKKTDPVDGSKSSSYGTSADTYIGYGPYKLTTYVIDQQMVFERNPNWFGYKDKYASTYGTFTAEFDGKVHKQFETDRIVLNYAPEISTREEMFKAGQLDVLGLNANMFQTYKSSERLYNATGASTFYGIINSNYDTLVECEAVANNTRFGPEYNGAAQAKNKTILSIKEFRQALCYALDRAQLVANLYPGGSPAISLFSDLIIADPENGVPFNSFDDTKKAICDFWGVEYTDENLEEKYKSITGYDLEGARALVDVAYDKAIELGYLGPTTVVSIDYCASSDSETEQKWYNTIKDCLVNLAKTTKLDGRLELNYDPTLGSDFGAAIQSGNADTAWGFGWSGGELDPYGLFQVYVDAADPDSGEPYQYDMWIDRSTDDYKVTVNVNGSDKTFSVYEWFLILNADPRAPQGLNYSYGKLADSERAKILAACEGKVLGDYTNIPMMNEGSVQLLTYKCNYGKETYLFGMGFGGIRYMTYNYTDGEWESFVNKQPGKTLSY